MPRAFVVTLVLVASSFTLPASDRAGERPGGQRAMQRWLLVTIALGAAFLANQLLEYRDARLPRRRPPLRLDLLGAHRPPRRPRHRRPGGDGAAVRPGRAQPHDPAAVASWAGGVSLFWHLVDVVWIFVFIDDLDPAVNVAAARCPAARRGRRRHRVADGAGAGERAAPAQSAAELGRELFVASAPAATASTARASRTAARRCYDEGRGGGRLRAAHRAACRWPQPDMQAKPGPGALQRRPRSVALVDYAGAFGDGPAIPDVDPAAGDLAVGGDAVPPQLRRLPRRVRCRRGDRRRPGARRR